MPPLRDLGPRGPMLGVADSLATGNINPYLPGTGWDVLFAPADLSIPPDGEIEVYHIALDGPVGSSGVWMRDGKQFGYFLGWTNEWDPQQPMILRGGQTVQFCWNTTATAGPYNRTTNIQPVVTLWLRRAQQLIQ